MRRAEGGTAIKRTVLLLAALLLLSGCGLVQTAIEALPEDAQEAVTGAVRSWSDRRWSLQDPIDAFFAAVDARDADAVRAMFSPNAQAADETLDQDIQALFDLYPGPTDECVMTTPVGASKHIGWGENAVTVQNTFPVVCQGVNYYCAFRYTTKDEADEGNVGIQSVFFASEKVQANEEFRDGLEYGGGLTVVSDCPGDYETRRIGDRPYIFTPIDRRLSADELTAFLQSDDSWTAFTDRFGQPNAESWPSSYYYELEPEDGQPRYACILTDSGGDAKRVWSVSLYDSHDNQPVEILWKQKTESSRPE